MTLLAAAILIETDNLIRCIWCPTARKIMSNTDENISMLSYSLYTILSQKIVYAYIT